MPTYLCHGFRWHRRDIRIFVIVNDMEDVAPDWIVGPVSSSLILSQFAESFDFLPKQDDANDYDSDTDSENSETTTRPNGSANKKLHHDDDFSMPPSRVPAHEDHVLMHGWSSVKLLEEYDPDETLSSTRPYAYVADYVARIDLSADVTNEMSIYQELSKERDTSWFEQLRDKVQDGADIGWFVVVCGDTERAIQNQSDGEYTETTTDDEPPRTETTSSLSARGDWPLSNDQPATTDSTREKCERGNSVAGNSPSTYRNYTAMKPPPTPTSTSSNAKSQHQSLRRKISKAGGLSRLFRRRGTQS